tara:strand:- start:490 stop:591 length:102 start_codon:yes stop_codon:yes gene_type:complete
MLDFAPAGFARDLAAFVSMSLFVASFGVVMLAL